MKTQDYAPRKVVLTVVLFVLTVSVAPWLWLNMSTSSELRPKSADLVTILRHGLSQSPVAAVI